jgi:transposase-like protein
VTIPQDDTQVAASASRRRFTAEYKLRILKEAEECKKTGMVGALLRREGLYSSRLSDWKNARARGELEALSPRKRGRKPIVVDPKDQRIAKLEGQLKKAEARAERAEALVELQKKIAALLGQPIKDDEP